ncbi:MAG: MazG nucleotide pyrophosphohydrolase domain-containing protein [Specibacter sp.]
MTRTDAPMAAPGAGAAIERLADVIAELREHCLWTAALTHESLITYLVEESYELADVVEAPGPLDVAELKGELGDILYQVVLHSRLQAETGAFTLADVAEHLRAKLIRRNSHVFRSDGTLQDTFPESIAEIERNYAAQKAAEKPPAVATGAGVFDSLPSSLPALALAAKTLDRAGARGSRAAGERDPDPHTEDELGELLFDVVRSAHARGLDAERALRLAVQRFQAGG